MGTGVDGYLKELKKTNSASNVEKVKIASQNFKEDSVGLSPDVGNQMAAGGGKGGSASFPTPSGGNFTENSTGTNTDPGNLVAGGGKSNDKSGTTIPGPGPGQAK